MRSFRFGVFPSLAAAACLLLLCATPAHAIGSRRVNSAKGFYGGNPNDETAQTLPTTGFTVDPNDGIEVFDPSGTQLLFALKSSARCVTGGSNCGTANTVYAYFYFVRIKSTITGAFQLTIPGAFNPLDSSALSFGIIDADDGTGNAVSSIAACPSVPQGTHSTCIDNVLDATSQVTSAGVTFTINPQSLTVSTKQLVAGDFVVLYLTSFIAPPNCGIDIAPLHTQLPSFCSPQGSLTPSGAAPSGGLLTPSSIPVLSAAPVTTGRRGQTVSAYFANANSGLQTQSDISVTDAAGTPLLKISPSFQQLALFDSSPGNVGFAYVYGITPLADLTGRTINFSLNAPYNESNSEFLHFGLIQDQDLNGNATSVFSCGADLNCLENIVTTNDLVIVGPRVFSLDGNKLRANDYLPLFVTSNNAPNCTFDSKTGFPIACSPSTPFSVADGTTQLPLGSPTILGPSAPIPVPMIGSLAPNSRVAGLGAFTLTVTSPVDANQNPLPTFVFNSQVFWNGSGRATTFVSQTQLVAQILDTDTNAPGVVPVTVVSPPNPSNNGPQNGGPSNASSFNVIPATPTAVPSPATINVSQAVNTTSVVQNVSLQNNGNATLNLTSIVLNGTDKAFFTLTAPSAGTPCSFGASTLAAGSSCSFGVTFKPTDSINYNASVAITDNAADSPQTVTLMGTGLGSKGALTPSPLPAFATTLVGATSATQTVTLKNNGNQTLMAIVPSFSTGNTADFKMTNHCAATLAQGISCTIDLAFMPTATGARTTKLLVNDNDPSGAQSLTLSGTGIQPAATVTPSPLPAFPDTPVNSTSAAQVVTIKNTGSATLNISSIGFNPATTDFSIASKTCAATLAVNATCTVNVTFTPKQSGGRQGTLQISDDAPNSPQSLALSGNGLQASVTFAPTTPIAFADTLVGQTTAAQTVTITNSGNTALHVTSVAPGAPNAADFVLSSNTCNGATVNAGANCSVSVAFKPTQKGARSSALQVADDASGSPQSLALSGNGLQPHATISPANGLPAFADTLVGSTSATQTVTVTNDGNATLHVSSAAFNPATPDFTLTNGCTPEVNPNSNCTLTIAFKPSKTGSLAATLVISDDDPSATQNVSVSGKGVQPNATTSPSSLPAFPLTLATVASSPQTVTVNNTGSAPLHITNIAFTGANSGDFSKSADTCLANAVSPGSSCTISVVYKPAAAGPSAATLQITDDAPSGTQTVAVSGTADDFSLPAPSGAAATQTIHKGGTATYTLALSSVDGFVGAVNLSCTTTEPGAPCGVTPNPASLTANASTNVTVNVGAAIAIAPPVRFTPPKNYTIPTLVLAFLVLLAFLLLRSSANGPSLAPRPAFVLASSVLLIALSGCSGGGQQPPPPPPPPQNFTVTVTATAGNRAPVNVTLTLIVQP
jgi:hypothetical protein